MSPLNHEPPDKPNEEVTSASTGFLDAQHDDIMAIATPLALGMIDGHVSVEESESNNEVANLQALAEKYGVEAEIIPIGEAGHVVRLPRTPGFYVEPTEATDRLHFNGWPELTAYSPIVAFDADDTLFAYTQTKEQRLQRYSKLAADLLERELNPELGEKIMSIADEFSRWEESGEQMYHIAAHKAALGWMTSQLIGVEPDEQAEKIQDMEKLLEQTKHGHEVDVPFCITDHKFVVKDLAKIADVDQVFEPMIKPDRYHDAVSAATKLASEGVRTVIFTYGEPEFQLEKILALQKQQISDGGEWPYTDVLLTKRSKGEFLEEIARVAQKDPRLKADFFAEEPHVFVLVDDDPKQLTDFMSRSEAIGAQSGAELSSVRSTRANTKAEQRPWSADPYKNGGDYAKNRVIDTSSDSAERFDTITVIYSILRSSIEELINSGVSTEAEKILDSQKRRFTTLEHNRIYINGGFDGQS